MQFTKTSLLAALSALATADFQIYSDLSIFPNMGIGGGDLNRQQGFYFVPGEASCDDVNHAPFIGSQDDASGSRTAVRCVGCDDQPPADWTITELEWNTDMGHFTIYGLLYLARWSLILADCFEGDSGFQITPTDGSPTRGSCVVDQGDVSLSMSCIGISRMLFHLLTRS